jgi:hypothetical protein
MGREKLRGFLDADLSRDRRNHFAETFDGPFRLENVEPPASQL